MRNAFSVIALAGLIVCADAGDANAQRNGYGRGGGGRGGVGVTISGAGITIGQPGYGYYGNPGYGSYPRNYGNSFGYGNPGYQNYGNSFGYRGFGNGYNSGYGYNSGLGLGYNRSYYSPAPVYNSMPYYTTPNYVVPATYSIPLVDNSVPMQQATPTASVAQNRAYITVIVPTTDAEVWIAGTTTDVKGAERLFHSPVLEAGKTFKYAIKAKWTIDGKTSEQTRDVEFQAGQSTRVDFRTPQSENALQRE